MTDSTPDNKPSVPESPRYYMHAVSAVLLMLVGATMLISGVLMYFNDDVPGGQAWNRLLSGLVIFAIGACFFTIRDIAMSVFRNTVEQKAMGEGRRDDSPSE
jgi:type VI protein secretion system component VasK